MEERCFFCANFHYPSSTRLWLRMGLCIVLVFCPGPVQTSHASEARKACRHILSCEYKQGYICERFLCLGKKPIKVSPNYFFDPAKTISTCRYFLVLFYHRTTHRRRFLMPTRFNRPMRPIKLIKRRTPSKDRRGKVEYQSFENR